MAGGGGGGGRVSDDGVACLQWGLATRYGIACIIVSLQHNGSESSKWWICKDGNVNALSYHWKWSHEYLIGPNRN